MKNAGIPATLLALCAGVSPHAISQVITDGSVGAQATLSGPSRTTTIPDSLGLRQGINLIHSFSVFSIRTGETAIFSGIPFIQNIIARVTGGTPSSIDGTLRSTIPGSNLFLVNPSGIVFGPNASINVPGSFHASSAHYLRLEDGTVVSMRSAEGVTLTAAAPAAFGFEGSSGPITLSGTQLRVAEGRRIGLSGGEIRMGAADTGRVSVLSAPSGTIGVLAANSAGEAEIAPGGFRAQGFGAMAPLTLQENTLVSVNEGPGRRGGGAISLAGGAVSIDHSNVESRTAFAAGRGISVTGTESISVSAGNVISVTRGAGDAGPLRLEGRDITLSNGSLVDTSCDPGCTTGAGGSLTVVASANLAILGDNAQVPTYLVSNSFGGGRTGAIDIHAGSLSVRDNAFVQGIATAAGNGTSITIASNSIALTGGAQVDVSTRGAGQGGAITVNNAGAIHIEGTRIANAATGLKNPSGFFSNTEASGTAGSIVISTASLEVLAGGEISSSSRPRATGDGGRISITASGRVFVSGTDSDFKSSGIVSNTFTTGHAGDIEIAARSIEITNDGRIQVQSEGAGRSGSVRLRADTMTLTGRGQVSSDARSTGDGGTIEADITGTLAISGFDSGFFAKTYGPARGGSVVVHAGEIVMSDRGGIFAGTDGTGKGGDLKVVAAGDVDIGGDARITVESRAPGEAGSITLSAGGAIDVHDGGKITAESSNTGGGGSIVVTTPGSLTLQSDGRITAESLSTGLAGTITVDAGETIALLEGGRITTQALLSDGGDIFVTAGREGVMSSGQITTAVSTGKGGGGNITLRVPTFLMSDSVISANAYGGDGGNVRIGTTTFVPSANSKVTASSALGIDGTITFESPAVDPTGELLVPAPAFVDAGSVLAGRCGPRLAGRASSLVVAPRMSLSESPDGWRLVVRDEPVAERSVAQWTQPLVCTAWDVVRSAAASRALAAF